MITVAVNCDPVSTGTKEVRVVHDCRTTTSAGLRIAAIPYPKDRPSAYALRSIENCSLVHHQNTGTSALLNPDLTNATPATNTTIARSILFDPSVSGRANLIRDPSERTTMTDLRLSDRCSGAMICCCQNASRGLEACSESFFEEPRYAGVIC